MNKTGPFFNSPLAYNFDETCLQSITPPRTASRYGTKPSPSRKRRGPSPKFLKMIAVGSLADAEAQTEKLIKYNQIIQTLVIHTDSVNTQTQKLGTDDK